MLCFEVAVNGESVCRAGAEGLQGLSTHVQWAKRTKDGKVEEFLYLSASGMTEEMKHVTWKEQEDLKPGDEILIRITEATSADVPKVSTFLTGAMQDAITEMVSKVAKLAPKEE